MKDRFDLETEISELYNFAEHINTISTGIIENTLDEDDVINALVGISVLLKLQTNKLHDTMSQCFKLGNYNDL